MNKLIILSGATGDLGRRVLLQLVHQGAQVRCLVRVGTTSTTTQSLARSSVEVVAVDVADEKQLARACEGGSALVSTVSGLREVIVDYQTRLLRAAVSAGVPRFIPSDYAIDYRVIPHGDNRNLNLREEFREILDGTGGIKATSILNGAFMDMLTGVAPFILFPLRRVLCWGSQDQLMDWTTMDDTAKFTAFAALDDSAPRFLRIAGEELSARKLAEIMTTLTGKTFRILRPGSPDMLRVLIWITKLFVPGKQKIYPAWQGMQYMHNMYVGRCKHPVLDNNRYPVSFTTASQLLSDFLNGALPKYSLNQ